MAVFRASSGSAAPGINLGRVEAEVMLVRHKQLLPRPLRRRFGTPIPREMPLGLSRVLVAISSRISHEPKRSRHVEPQRNSRLDDDARRSALRKLRRLQAAGKLSDAGRTKRHSNEPEIGRVSPESVGSGRVRRSAA
jgi:hypothetical protein